MNRKRLRPGNIALFLAGANREVLEIYRVDRAYYTGLGMSVLFTAVVSTTALAEASSIAFHVHGVALAAVAVTYFVLIAAFDRWLVSDAITGFVRPERGALVPVAWFGHLVVEIFKIAGRIAIAVLSSWLFASFLLLAVFNHEIQEQLKGIETQNNAKYNVQLQAVTDQLSGAAQTTIGKAQKQANELTANYTAGQSAIEAAQKTEQAGLDKAHAQGIYCQTVPVYSWYTNRVTGGTYRVQTGSATECPQEIQDIESAYNKTVSAYPQSYLQLQNAIHDVMNTPAVLNAEKTVTDAPATAAAELGPEKPTDVDGLAARRRALALITNKPAKTCPAKPTAQDLASNDACIANYSPDVASMQTNLRFWLFSLEIAPVAFKLMHSLLPRRGYAWQMAANDYDAKNDAQLRMEAARIKKRAEIAKLLRLERVNLELETTLEEQQLREAARASGAVGLKQIRGRLAKAIAQNVRTARKDAEPLVDALEVIYDPNVQGFESEPTLRIIDDDQHLYD